MQAKKTETNNGGFSVSRNGDSGTRLAAGEILPPFLFRGLYLTAKMVYYKCEVFYE